MRRRWSFISGLLGGAASASIAPYDTRFGTATDTTTGWITFGLRPGCRRIWVNGGRADDTGDGLSAATAKKTLDAAKVIWLGGGYTAADQLMVAEGNTYTDGSGTWWRDSGGFSLTYPIACLSYDPADAANATKYGRAVGAKTPIILTDPAAGITLFGCGGATGTNYYALQGVEIRPIGGVNTVAIQFTGRHDGVCFQNVRFNRTFLGLQNSNSIKALVSKCAFWGQWSSSGATACLIGDTIDAAYFQDTIAVHAGWKIGQNRDTDTTVGGANFLSHAFYYHASNTNGRFDRIVYVDSSADGHNQRGQAAATQLVALDEPFGLIFGGWSASPAEAPAGVLNTLDDFAILGADDIQHGNGLNRGYAINSSNTIVGSYIRNGVIIDSPSVAVPGTCILYCGQVTTNPITQTLLLDKISEWNYSAWLENGVDGSQVNTFSNSFVDSFFGQHTHTTTPGTVLQTGYGGARTTSSGASAVMTSRKRQYATGFMRGSSATSGVSIGSRTAKIL
jgi:hypothetical protein